MIGNRNVKGALKSLGSEWLLPVSITGAAYHLGTGPNNLNGVAVGSAPTGFAAFYTKTVQSLFFTPSIAAGTATFRLTGYNQFNEGVSELMTFTGATAQQSVLCYRRVTNFVVTAISGGSFGATDSITIGYSLVQPRLPMLAKLSFGSSVLAAFDVNQPTLASQGALTATTVSAGSNPYERYTILLAATLLTPTSGSGLVIAHIDPNDSGL